MNPTTANPCCRRQQRAKNGWFALLRRRLSIRLQDHIASCPRCRRRLADTGKVELALQLLVSEPHCLTLLQRANLAALKMLTHHERYSPQADALRNVLPQPNWTWRHSRRLEKLLQIAACAAVVCLLKLGLFSFFQDIREEGQAAVRNYYASNLPDENLLKELFDEPSQRA